MSILVCEEYTLLPSYRSKILKAKITEKKPQTDRISTDPKCSSLLISSKVYMYF